MPQKVGSSKNVKSYKSTQSQRHYSTLHRKKLLPPHTQGYEHGPCVEQICEAHIKSIPLQLQLQTHDWSQSA